MSKTKREDIYFRIVAVVYQQPDGRAKDPHPQRLILKLQDEDGFKYVGLQVDTLHIADDLLEVAERMQKEIGEPSKVLPPLKTVATDKKH
jgi:hypothetical protein